jgi:lysophospholipid acyltransferase (LPLAT)-like uncharacterized protein
VAFKRIRDARWFRAGAGALLANYLRFVQKTNRFVLEPVDLYERLEREFPEIVTFWHGQHFMTPFMRRPGMPAKALISMHRDADINAIAVENMGFQTIRGSGDHGGRFDRKGGVRAFIAMREALAQGWIVGVTADVPKIARVAGLGVIMLSKSSGRPIYPLAMATSRRIVLRNWDRSVINLPFGRGAIVLGEAIRVPADADEAALEACRSRLEASLNTATARAYEVVDARAGRSKKAHA